MSSSVLVLKPDIFRVFWFLLALQQGFAVTVTISRRHFIQLNSTMEHQRSMSKSTATLTSLEMELGMAALRDQQRIAEKGGAPSCMGLTKKMCKACPKGGPGGFCKAVNTMCGDLFCNPLCRQQTWKCDVKWGKFKKEKGDSSYSKALCAQFIAYGCQKMMKCCPKNDALLDYVENWAFAYGQEPRYPSPSCISGPSGKLCGQCKGAVKVKLKALKCKYPSAVPKRKLLSVDEEVWDEENEEHEINEEQNFDWDGLGRNAMATAIHPFGINSAITEPASRPVQPHPLNSLSPSLLEVKPTGFKKGQFPGENAHKEMADRCGKMLTKVKAKLGGMKSKFQSNACKCLGCCKGKCFYPITENFPANKFDKKV